MEPALPEAITVTVSCRICTCFRFKPEQLLHGTPAVVGIISYCGDYFKSFLWTDGRESFFHTELFPSCIRLII